MGYFDELVIMLEGVIPSIINLPTFILEVLPATVVISFSIIILFVIGYILSKIKDVF